MYTSGYSKIIGTMSIYIYVCWVYLVIKSYKLLISCCIYKVMFVRLLKIAFIQLLKLCGVYSLYINCWIYRKCNLTVVKKCLPCRWPSRAQVERGLLSQLVHGTATYRCDVTRRCIIQFWPPDDEHIVLETCTGI